MWVGARISLPGSRATTFVLVLVVRRFIFVVVVLLVGEQMDLFIRGVDFIIA